ncbi:MAG: PQQ-binding-like beta-propeller repeat protein [Planctomycetota bacterium]
MLRSLVPGFLCAAALPASALLAQAPTYVAEEDVEVAGSTQVPLAGPRSDWAERSAAQAGTLITLGGSYGIPSGSDRLATVSAVDAEGSVLWTWVNDTNDKNPVALFAPRDGTGAFATLQDFDEGRSLLRIDDGVETWRVDLQVSFGGIFPLFELAGADDGSRLFSLLEQGSPSDLVTSHDPVTGAALWSTQLAFDTRPIALATDAAGAVVYVLQDGGSGLTVSRVDAYDGATGALLWTTGLALFAGDATPTSLAVDPAGSLVTVGFEPVSGTNNLVGLQTSDGAELWTTAVPGVVEALDVSPLGPDVLVVAREPVGYSFLQPLFVHGVRPQTGEIKWTLGLPELSKSTPIFTDVDAGTQRMALWYDASESSAVVARKTFLAVIDVLNDGATIFSELDVLPVGDFPRMGGVAFVETTGATRLLRSSSDFPVGQIDEDFEVTAYEPDGTVTWTTLFGIEEGVPEGVGLAAPAGGPAAFGLLRNPGGLREVVAVDRNDASLLWQVELPLGQSDFNFFGPGDPIAAAADGSLVYASLAGTSTFHPGGLDGLDGATGAVLWTESYTGFGNARDLVAAQPAGAAGPVAYVHHGHTGDSFLSETAMRAVDGATGATLWVEEWPTAGFDTWWAGALAVDEPGDRVFGLVGAQFPSDELRVLERDALTGALLSNTVLNDSDFDPVLSLGVPQPSDLALSEDGTVLFVLGRYLGTTEVSARLAFAALDVQTGTVLWGRAVDPTPGSLSGPGELVLAPGGGVLAIVTGASAAPGDPRVAALGIDTATGATLWERSLGTLAEPRTYLDAEPGADPRTLAIAAGRGDGLAEALTLDLATGTTLHTVTADTASGGDRMRALASGGGATFALVDATSVVPGGAADVARLDPKALVFGPGAVSLAEPEPAVFLLDRPASEAGDFYFVAGSATGTSPGVPFGSVLVPLVPDPYFLATVTDANQPPFVDTFGVLDANGDARAELAVPSGLAASLAGVTLYHAFVQLTPGFAGVFASEAVTLQLEE